MCKKVRARCGSPPNATCRTRHGSSRLMHTIACLIGENPTCSVPALHGCGGLCVKTTATHEMSTLSLRPPTTGRRYDKQKAKKVIFGRNVVSTQMLEALERCFVSKGMRGQWSNDYGMQQMSTPPHPPCPHLPFPFLPSANSYSLEVVAPASERVINRNRPVVTRMATETAEMYASITSPHIDKVVGDGRSLSWLFNVLSKEKEAERVLLENDDPVRAVLV